MQQPAVQCWFLICLVCLALKVNTVQAQCSKPTGNANTVIAGDDISKDTFEEGSVVTFQCAVGYVIESGRRTTTCTGGQWSPLRLKCEIRSCGSPGQVTNGRFNTSSGFDFGATVVAICDRGYFLVGSAERHCLAAGWSDRVPVCEVVKCGRPPVIDNGGPIMPPEETYTYGQVVSYKCDEEYTLVGNKALSCSENEKFEPAAPECKIVICPTPDIPNAKQISGAREPFKYRNYVTYECLPGYEMKGEASLHCQITSEWSADFPTCKALPTTTKPTTTSTTTTPARPTKKTTPKEGPGPTDKPKETGNGNGGIIAGSIVGVLAVGLICFGVFFYKKKRANDSPL